MNIAYNMDCLEAMRQMPDKAFDLAVVDPPCGNARSRNIRESIIRGSKNAKDKADTPSRRP